eukprot:4188857-Pleurochrysis_carterae.AAC.2
MMERSKRASEVIDMMWVLEKKRDEKGEVLKYKARAVMRQSAEAQGDGGRHGAHPRDVRAGSALRHLANYCAQWAVYPTF